MAVNQELVQKPFSFCSTLLWPHLVPLSYKSGLMLSDVHPQENGEPLRSVCHSLPHSKQIRLDPGLGMKSRLLWFLVVSSSSDVHHSPSEISDHFLTGLPRSFVGHRVRKQCACSSCEFCRISFSKPSLRSLEGAMPPAGWVSVRGVLPEPLTALLALGTVLTGGSQPYPCWPALPCLVAISKAKLSP